MFGISYSISCKIFIPTDIWLKGAVQICCPRVIIQLSIGHPLRSIVAVRFDEEIKFQVYIVLDSSDGANRNVRFEFATLHWTYLMILKVAVRLGKYKVTLERRNTATRWDTRKTLLSYIQTIHV